MEAQARTIGISIERFPAVDGSTLERNPFPGIGLGAVGCFLSHRAVWSKIAQSADRFALVLEDDAHLSLALPRFLIDDSWIPPGVDIVHAERTQPIVTVSGRARAARDRKLVKAQGGNTGTGCYFISRECATKLAANFTTIDVEFDQILFSRPQPNLAIYKLLPALSVQDKLTAAPHFQLTIEREDEERVNHARLSLGGKIAREARRVGRKIQALFPAETRRVRVKFR